MNCNSFFSFLFLPIRFQAHILSVDFFCFRQLQTKNIFLPRFCTTSTRFAYKLSFRAAQAVFFPAFFVLELFCNILCRLFFSFRNQQIIRISVFFLFCFFSKFLFPRSFKNHLVLVSQHFFDVAALYPSFVYFFCCLYHAVIEVSQTLCVSAVRRFFVDVPAELVEKYHGAQIHCLLNPLKSPFHQQLFISA